MVEFMYCVFTYMTGHPMVIIGNSGLSRSVLCNMCDVCWAPYPPFFSFFHLLPIINPSDIEAESGVFCLLSTH